MSVSFKKKQMAEVYYKILFFKFIDILRWQMVKESVANVQLKIYELKAIIKKCIICRKITLTKRKIKLRLNYDKFFIRIKV